MAVAVAAAAGAGAAEVPAAPAVCVSDEEQQPAEVPKAQARGDLKRKRDADLTKKAERLESEASLAEEDVRERTAAIRAKAEELRKLEEELRKRQERAAAARRAAFRARSEAALHDLPPVPARPSNPFNLFQKEMMPQVAAEENPRGKKPMQRLSELWNQLPQEEKKKYTDRFYQEQKEYREWERSEEGKVVLAKRHDILKAYSQGDTQEPDAKASPAAKQAKEPDAKATPAAKRANAPVEPSTTPVKPQRGAAARQPSSAAPAAAEPCIDEAVLQEASALSLQGLLLNLAGRPEVRAMKKPPHELLKALKDSGGMVNAAKRILVESGER